MVQALLKRIRWGSAESGSNARGGVSPPKSPAIPAAVPGSFQDLTPSKESERVQRALYRISEAAHTAPSLQDLFTALHAVVGDLMPARNLYIALHDPATDTLSFPYFVDEVDPPPPCARARPSSSSSPMR